MRERGVVVVVGIVVIMGRMTRTGERYGRWQEIIIGGTVWNNRICQSKL